MAEHLASNTCLFANALKAIPIKKPSQCFHISVKSSLVARNKQYGIDLLGCITALLHADRLLPSRNETPLNFFSSRFALVWFCFLPVVVLVH